MKTYPLYTGFTHASCKKMRACAIEILAKRLQLSDEKGFCTAGEIDLLKKVIEQLGPKENKDNENA